MAGPDAYGNHFLRTSLAGASLVVVIYGILGIVWGYACAELGVNRHSPFVTLAGAASGLAVYFVFFHFVWPNTRPLLTLYAPERQLEAASRSDRFRLNTLEPRR